MTGAGDGTLQSILDSAEAASVWLIRHQQDGDMDSRLSRITIDPAVCHGKPCVRGLRAPVESLLELLGSGMTPDEILADCEDLERDDLLTVLEYAARLARTRWLQAVGPWNSSWMPSCRAAWRCG